LGASHQGWTGLVAKLIQQGGGMQARIRYTPGEGGKDGYTEGNTHAREPEGSLRR
jgi:hypothetical protein